MGRPVIAASAVALLVATSLAVWSAWGPKHVAAPRWNVIVITLDTTRADHLGCYGARHETPTIDALSRQGVRFERCFCTVPLTLPSHCSLMTGLMPLRHGVHDNGPDRLAPRADTLAEVLSGHGYKTAAVVGAFVLDHQFGLNQGFEHYDDRMPDISASSGFRYPERNAQQVTDAALEWLKVQANRPFFLWVHYFDAHAPYAPPNYNPQLATRRPYDAEIAFVDSQLKRLLGGLEQLGDQSLVILTADHGEGLGQHGEDTHGLFTYNPTLRVPFVVRFPDGRHAGRVVHAPISLTDMMPSILRWLDIDYNESLDGVPLALDDFADQNVDRNSRAIAFENRFPASMYGWSPVDGIVVGSHKLIRAPKPELYDLNSDPGEQNNLFETGAELARQLTVRLDAVTEQLASQSALDTQAVDMSNSDSARLRALGYVGARKPAYGQLSIPSDDLADPKDMLQVYDQVQQVTILLEQRQIARATEMLLEILESSDSTNNRALRLLAAQELDDPALRDRAIACLQRAADRKDHRCNDVFVLGKLGLTLLADDRPAEAVHAFARLVQIEPNNGIAYRYLAEAQRCLGDSAQAARWHERALELTSASDQPPEWDADAKGQRSLMLRP